MTWFLLKGLLRDRHRSLFPVIIVSAGVMISILINCWVKGVVGDITTTNAKLDTGHVKIMTRAYHEIASQVPNDLALFGSSELLSTLRQDYPNVDWAPRIKFGGLLDIPDEQGETRAQGPVFGMAIDLLSPVSKEKERLNLENALVQGRLPQAVGEIVISDQFAQSLGVKLGEAATLVSATANGGMAIHNFSVTGTIRFGVDAMDRSAMLADISDIQYALDMDDGAGEILGFLPNLLYDAQVTENIAATFNAKYQTPAQEGNGDEFAPMMITLRDQNGLGEYLDLINVWIFVYLFGFIGVMSIVLWNTGLMSGIRRYGEVGVRLAIGESKGHVYRTLIYESILIGIIGSVFGTLLGLGISYYLQEYGIDISGMMQGGSMLISTVLRARITPVAFYIGFIPGLLATTLGSMMAGIGIFRRQTSQLFKELET
jgi:putative ABC transport system permease protein